MNRKIQAIVLFSAIISFMGLFSISFSEDGFDDGIGFHHWQKRLIESKGSKNVVLLEMLGEAVREPQGYTFGFLQTQGPPFFYRDNPDNKRDFQRLLLNIFKTNDLHKLKSFYGIEEGKSDLLVARVFEIVFYLYAVETGFSYRLRENLKETLSWGWSDSRSPKLLSEIVKSMDEFLGPKVSYHVRARVKNIQPVADLEEVVVVIEWELVEVENAYNPKSDTLEATEKVIETRVVREFVVKAEADKIEGDYGTKAGLPIDREAVLTLFQNLSKTTRIVENPSPREIGSSNWERLIPLLPLLPGGMSFAPIPAGTFDMGSPDGESERDDDETLHRVTLTKSFEMMTTEVTQKQWEEVMGSNPSHFKGEDLPVEHVSWNDAQAFIQKLNERNDGWIYRLPTGAEWEYAARGGKKTAYSFEDNPALLKEHGWFYENSGDTTHPVASFPTKEKAKPNGFGLYDMYGNVWEWTLDTKAVSPDSSCCVHHGGGWSRYPLFLRSASGYYHYNSPGVNDNDLGFRVLRVPEAQGKQ